MRNIRHEPWWFLIGIVAFVALRFLHLGPLIDDPQSWRQCDTANYTWDFYQNGIDLLHPAVCWMGDHKTVVLEFPLPEAIMAGIYKIFGYHLILGRLLILLCFVIAVRYYYLILKLLVDTDLARVATLIYLMMPLGIFYSRAIHIDFFVVMLAHGMLYYYLKGTAQSDFRWMLLGTLFAIPGFMVKVPYMFYLALPAVMYVIYHRKWAFILRMSPLLLLPILSFYAWYLHAASLNGAAPDWSFIPTYRKFDDSAHWYFGVWEMREYALTWLTIKGRLDYEIMGGIGTWICIAGIFLKWRSFGHNFMRLWVLATFLYVLIFFNLNFKHDYYQIPLMAPAAFFLAAPFLQLHKWFKRLSPSISVMLILLLPLGWFGYNSVRLTEGWNLDAPEQYYFGKYFNVSQVPVQTGRLLQTETAEDELLIISYGGLDPRCPNMLYRARRNGWSIPNDDLNGNLIEKLRDEGADRLALVRNIALGKDVEQYLSQFPADTFRLDNINKTIRLIDLR